MKRILFLLSLSLIALLAVACRPPSEPTAVIPTATPLPSEQEALALFRGASVYQETPLFEVTYPVAQWKLAETALAHQLVPDCKLELTAGGRGMPGPGVVDEQTFGGRTWRVTSWPDLGEAAYALDAEEGYYLMALTYPPDADAAAIAACRAAADAVMDTFALAAE